jgi:hypothetical protein
MIRRITKTLLIVSMVIGFMHVGSSAFCGWPFASDDPPKTTMVSRMKQKPPSTWEKVSSGTKNFFNKTGETLGLKKKEPKKPPAVVAPRQRMLVQKAKKDSGGFLGLFGSKKKDENVAEWMKSTEQIKP